VPLPVPLLALVALLVGGGWSAPGWTILLSGSVGVASLLLAVVVQPTPLPEGLAAETSVRRSLHRFRQITALRIGLALSPVIIGAGASIAGGGMFPLAVALVLAWPQLVLAMPIFFTITRARRAMEAWGTRAYLWAALAQPAPVEWPIATRAVAAWRQYRTRSASARGGSADGAGDGPDINAESSTGLPDRLAVPASRSTLEPADLIPGFPMSGVPSPARRILRSAGAAPRRKSGPRRDLRRPKAKNG
jgi:hypothetical protein